MQGTSQPWGWDEGEPAGICAEDGHCEAREQEATWWDILENLRFI